MIEGVSLVVYMIAYFCVYQHFNTYTLQSSKNMITAFLFYSLYLPGQRCLEKQHKSCIFPNMNRWEMLRQGRRYRQFQSICWRYLQPLHCSALEPSSETEPDSLQLRRMLGLLGLGSLYIILETKIGLEVTVLWNNTSDNIHRFGWIMAYPTKEFKPPLT